MVDLASDHLSYARRTMFVTFLSLILNLSPTPHHVFPFLGAKISTMKISTNSPQILDINWKDARKAIVHQVFNVLELLLGQLPNVGILKCSHIVLQSPRDG